MPLLVAAGVDASPLGVSALIGDGVGAAGVSLEGTVAFSSVDGMIAGVDEEGVGTVSVFTRASSCGNLASAFGESLSVMIFDFGDLSFDDGVFDELVGSFDGVVMLFDEGVELVLWNGRGGKATFWVEVDVETLR